MKIQFQGDVCFVEVDSIPVDATPMKIGDGQYVCAHSETGHDHTVSADGCVAFDGPSDPNVCYLQMGDADINVIHHRAWDTHAPVTLKAKTVYMGIRQVERSPEGWRRVAD